MSELETERDLTRREVADYLREFADQLEGERGDAHAGAGGAPSDRDVGDEVSGTNTTRAPDRDDDSTVEREGSTDAEGGDQHHRTGGTHGGKVTLLVGNDSATINPPEQVRFGVEVGSDSSLMGGGKGEVVEFRIHWNAEDVPQDDELRIE